ncbi:MAG: DUF3088 family protein [Planctomycetota bacterium]|jgi:hypothetical protein
MARDILFLLKQDFVDGAGAPYYCPDCAQITGVLDYFSKLRYELDIRYVDFARPRKDIVAILSEQHQGCPVLILDQPPPMDALAYITGHVNGKNFISGAKAIGNYWSYKYGVSRPH